MRPASYLAEQNCIAFPLENQIYYSTTKDVNAGEPLKVWYAKGYAKKLNKPLAPSAVVQTQHCADEMAEIVGQNVAAFEDTQQRSDGIMSQHITNHGGGCDQGHTGQQHAEGTVQSSFDGQADCNTNDIVRQAFDDCEKAENSSGNNIIQQSIDDNQPFDITNNGMWARI